MRHCPPRSLSTRPPGICQTPGTIGVARALATQGLGDLGTSLFRSVCHSFLPLKVNLKTAPSVLAAKNWSPSDEKRTKAGPPIFGPSTHSPPTRRPFQRLATTLPLSLAATSEKAAGSVIEPTF